VEDHARVRHSVQLRPVRTCIGCRLRVVKSDLLRVVAVGVPLHPEVVPDPRGRMPGRGAYVHPDPRCLDLAERRRAFPRALRLAGPLDTSAVRAYVESRPQNHAAHQANELPNEHGDGS
jgi:predicted RNA-binding protein YlxR (DUF448 family)